MGTAIHIVSNDNYGKSTKQTLHSAASQDSKRLMSAGFNALVT
jgi:hypothetical protein